MVEIDGLNKITTDSQTLPKSNPGRSGVICCPTCRTVLNSEGSPGEKTCPACGYQYTIWDGVIDFTPDDRFYWGEISRDEMVQMNQRAQELGWFDAFLENIAGKTQRELTAYVLDRIRIAGLFHFYDPKRNEAVLDLGSGWGPISFGLSKFYQTVYSIDGVYERLQFQAIRARQDNISNLKIMKSTLLKLPLPDNSMDAVVVNGLLEWIGLSDEVTDPRVLQLRFLKEVYRVMKPGGKLYVGIENRVGIQFFMGGRDHSGLKFTSLLPRWLANLAVRTFSRVKGSSFFSGAETSYRTLTYSYWGYQKLLKDVGFTEPCFYWTRPSYNYPNASGSLDGTSIRAYLETIDNRLKSSREKTVLKALKWMPVWFLDPLIKLFSPDFLITASKEAQAGGLQEEFINLQRTDSFFRTTPGGRVGLGTSYYLLDRHRRGLEVEVNPNHQNVKTQFEVLSRTEVQGYPMNPDSESDVNLAAVWLAELQLKTRKGTWKMEEITAEFDRLTTAAKTYIEDAGLAALLDDYSTKYISVMSQQSIPVVTEHGEFTPSNIRIGPGAQIQVTHWEHSVSDGSPLMDIGAFYLSLLIRKGKVKGFHRQKSAGSLFSGFALEEEKIESLLSLAPAYFALRVLEREVGPYPITPGTYMTFLYWKRNLVTALMHGVEG